MKCTLEEHPMCILDNPPRLSMHARGLEAARGRCLLLQTKPCISHFHCEETRILCSLTGRGSARFETNWPCHAMKKSTRGAGGQGPTP